MAQKYLFIATLCVKMSRVNKALETLYFVVVPYFNLDHNITNVNRNKRTLKKFKPSTCSQFQLLTNKMLLFSVCFIFETTLKIYIWCVCVYVCVCEE